MSDGKTITDERLEDLIELASNAHNLWNDESSRTALAGWLELQSARVELERMRAANQWQPIETAPEGERVLVSYLFHGQRKASQVDIKERFNGEFVWASRYYDATHWQPLPPPPYAAQPNEVAGS